MNLNLQLHKLLLTSLIILLNTVVFSQDRKSKTIELNKNLIYGSVSVGNDLFAKAFYYDRILKGNIFWGKDILPIVKIGIGQHKAFEYNDGNYVTIQYGIISATETSHHFEIATGLKYYFNGSLHGKLPISSSLGYRFQKPGGLLVFRVGTGYPEIVYLGLGWSF